MSEPNGLAVFDYLSMAWIEKCQCSKCGESVCRKTMASRIPSITRGEYRFHDSRVVCETCEAIATKAVVA